MEDQIKKESVEVSLTPLNKFIEGIDTSDENKLILSNSFKEFVSDAIEWGKKAEKIIVTDISQLKEMEEAGIARKALKNIRVSVEHKRKDLKDESLKTGKNIDSVAKFLTNLITPTEEHLERQEKFADAYKAEQKMILTQNRMKLLAEVNVDGTFYNVGEMPEDVFDNLLKNSTLAFNTAKENEEKKEKERIENENRIIEEKRERDARVEILFGIGLKFNGQEFIFKNDYGAIAIANVDVQCMSFEEFSQQVEEAVNLKERIEELQIVNEEEKRIEIEAMKKTEEENLKNTTLQNERLDELLPLNPYGETIDMATLWTLSSSEYRKVFNAKSDAYNKAEKERQFEEKKKKAKDDAIVAELETQRLLNEGMKKDKEAREKREVEVEAERIRLAEIELSKGDKEKMESIISDLRNQSADKYTFKSAKYKQLNVEVNLLLEKIINHINQKLK